MPKTVTIDEIHLTDDEFRSLYGRPDEPVERIVDDLSTSAFDSLVHMMRSGHIVGR